MNVYDFDNTIYRGDSTADFVGYCWLHRPQSLCNLPRTAVCGLLYLLHLMPKLVFKENLYRMFRYIPDMDQLIEQFADSHLSRIKPWYRQQQKPDDLIISASPEFQIRCFAKKAGIQHVIASRVDPHTGRITGQNCHGQEKVRRLREAYPAARIEAFYSDSRSDLPLAELADQAYLVRGDRLISWPTHEHTV